MELERSLQRVSAVNPNISEIKLMENQTGSQRNSVIQFWRQISNNECLLVVVLAAIAAILRFYRINALPLWGDEYTTIRQAQNFGLRLDAAPYYLILRLIMTFSGRTDFLLRLPAAVLSTLAVIPIYFLGKALFLSRKAGALTALLYAVSAYVVEYSQQVRFYPLWFLSSATAFLAFVQYVRCDHAKSRFAILVAANLFSVFSHSLGFLVPVVQLVVYWLITDSNLKVKCAILFVGLVVALGLPFLIPRPVLEYPFLLLARYRGNTSLSSYSGPRGFHPTTVVKIPLAFFSYIFGHSVYPLSLWLVVPGALIFGYLFLRGLWALHSNRLVLTLLLMWLSLPPLILFLGFDVWAPSAIVGASSRHVVFVILAFHLIIAYGILSHRNGALLLGIIALAFSALFLAHYYYPTWSKKHRLTDWHAAASFVRDYSNDQTVVLHDGRSNAPVKRYFPSSLSFRNMWLYDNEEKFVDELYTFDRLIFVTHDYKENNRRVFTQVLRNIEKQFVFIDGYVDFPLFLYVYQKTRSSGYPIDLTTEVVPLPKEIYGSKFSDLHLPQQVSYEGKRFPLEGSFGVPSLDGERNWAVPLGQSVTAIEMSLLSNLTGLLSSSWAALAPARRCCAGC
jgi:hypothetical protein